MDYELTPIETKAAGKSHVLMGTIVDTRDCDIKTYAQGDDKWVIRADVEIDEHGLFEDIPVFYHCQFSKTAGRAAFEEVEEGKEDDLITEGSPFVKDDRVMVLNDGDSDSLSVENLKIVGYEDGLPRQCVFQFRITRDDGTVIDESLLSYILIHQSTDSSVEVIGSIHGYHPADDPEDAAFWVKEEDTWHYSRETSPGYLTECSYNTITQIWTVPFVTWPDKEPKYGKDFWASFLCEGSVACMYVDREIDSRGYIYIRDDFCQESHKIVSKFYEVVVPYYKLISTFRTPLAYPDECEDSWFWCWYASGGLQSVTIKSSIPYTIMFKAPASWAILYPTGSYWGNWVENCLHYPPDCAACQAEADTRGARWCSTDPYPIAIDESANVTATCSNGTVSNNLKTNRIWEEQVITPAKNIVQTDEHSIVLSYNGSGSHTLTRECSGGGTINFFVGFRFFKLDIGIDFSPNT